MQNKVTVYEITHISPGERKVFELPTFKAMRSAKNTAYALKKCRKALPYGVERYSCQELGKKNGAWLVAITAVEVIKQTEDDEDENG